MYLWHGPKLLFLGTFYILNIKILFLIGAYQFFQKYYLQLAPFELCSRTYQKMWHQLFNPPPPPKSHLIIVNPHPPLGDLRFLNSPIHWLGHNTKLT